MSASPPRKRMSFSLPRTRRYSEFILFLNRRFKNLICFIFVPCAQRPARESGARPLFCFLSLFSPSLPSPKIHFPLLLRKLLKPRVTLPIPLHYALTSPTRATNSSLTC